MKQLEAHYPEERGRAKTTGAGAAYGIAGVEDLDAQGASRARRQEQVAPKKTAVQEDPARFCPVCSKRLEPRRCKLICNGCGYYMSCADYY